MTLAIVTGSIGAFFLIYSFVSLQIGHISFSGDTDRETVQHKMVALSIGWALLGYACGLIS
jgi:hypothetical protein